MKCIFCGKELTYEFEIEDNICELCMIKLNNNAFIVKTKKNIDIYNKKQ